MSLIDNKVMVGENNFIEYTVSQDILDVWRLEAKLEFVYNGFAAYDLEGDGAARFVPSSNQIDGSYSSNIFDFGMLVFTKHNLQFGWNY